MASKDDVATEDASKDDVAEENAAEGTDRDNACCNDEKSPLKTSKPGKRKKEKETDHEEMEEAEEMEKERQNKGKEGPPLPGKRPRRLAKKVVIEDRWVDRGMDGWFTV